MERVFRLPAGLHSFLILLKLSQDLPLSLEADGGSPPLDRIDPVDTGGPAGVVPAELFALQQLHTGPVHKGQALLDLCFLAAAASGMPDAKVVGADHRLTPAFTAAAPGRVPAEVSCRLQNCQHPELLSRHVDPTLPHGSLPPSASASGRTEGNLTESIFCPVRHLLKKGADPPLYT